ncbi:hypothetical protein BCV69DRAFT_309852 [Microstroma glucosiphilum]|uniref:Uncharacterized protein n=1 Tax=Pseudomicrostroma glucosiphilum TaxID=1684307 RepID=A0A316UFK3_9BASI|nr:hypothetical protein BCV69DRAFT_309852 [Pseudomicrostroma glucosiphilum]PWN24000.1 hypothetical protein BCV69DRAFT_309852 [Pseudomicrostroma glucosiphilum]
MASSHKVTSRRHRNFGRRSALGRLVRLATVRPSLIYLHTEGRTRTPALDLVSTPYLIYCSRHSHCSHTRCVRREPKASDSIHFVPSHPHSSSIDVAFPSRITPPPLCDTYRVTKVPSTLVTPDSMQRSSPAPSQRRPLSPRSALRSLQDPSGSSGTAHEGYQPSRSGEPHPTADSGPLLQRSGFRPSSSPDDAFRSRFTVSPTTLGPGDPPTVAFGPSHSSGPRPPTSATFAGYPQAHRQGTIESHSHMFAPESVFTASSRQAQRQHYLPPAASQLAERHEAGPLTPSYASMYPPEHPQPLSRSLDRNFQHSHQSLPALPIITGPLRASPHAQRYSSGQRYEDESTSAYSSNTPRASVSTPGLASARSSESQYSGHSFSNEPYTPQELLMPGPHRLSSSVTQRAYLPMPPRRPKPARSFDDYLAPLNQANFGSEASSHSPASMSSSSRYSVPNTTYFQLSPPLRQASRLSSSPASTEGWMMNPRKRSPASATNPPTTLPPMMLSGGPSPTRRYQREEEPTLPYRYSRPSSDQEGGGQVISEPVITTVSSAPALLTSLKRPRRWTDQADEGDRGRARSPPTSPSHSSLQRPRAQSSDRAKRRGKATASPPEMSRLSHTEVMNRLNRKMRERLAIKAASASPSSSPPRALSISGLTGPRESNSPSSTPSTSSGAPASASRTSEPSPQKRQAQSSEATGSH